MGGNNSGGNSSGNSGGNSSGNSSGNSGGNSSGNSGGNSSGNSGGNSSGNSGGNSSGGNSSGGNSSGGNSSGGNSGNSSGGSGTSLLLASLVGEYDLELALPVIDGCETYRSWSHFNTRVIPNEKSGISPLVSEDWAFSDISKFTVGNNELVLPKEVWGSDTTRPELHLPFGPAGFTGVATAEVPYLCATLVETVSVSGTIGPDITPPRLRTRAETPGSVLLPFDLFLFDFSESVIPETAWEAPVHLFTDPAAALGFIDTQTGLAPDYYWRTWPWGPASVVGFNDPSGMNDHSMAIELRQQFTDHAGHPAVVDKSSYPILNAGLPVKSVDFDVFNPQTAYGNVELIAADAADSPCESGACLALDYAARTCLGPYKIDEPVPTFVAARFLRDGGERMNVRYRILSTKPESPALFASEAAGCGLWTDETRYDLSPLDVAYGDYSYATAWLTVSNKFCLDPVQGESGVFLGLADACGKAGDKFRLLIERVEVVP
jgi:hypothetical protein